MDNRLRGATNQRRGSSFESAIAFHAAQQDLLAIKAGQSVRFLAGGRMLAVKSALDFTLMSRTQQICFADAKAFEGARFSRSALNEHQRQLASKLEGYGFVAGFIVHLRQIDAVVFYTAATVHNGGARGGFGVGEGIHLGNLRAFSIHKVWAV